MTTQLIIKDVRPNILDYDRYISKRAGLLYEFFEFWPVPRNFHDPSKLADCFFFDLHISRYVKNWVPGVPPPPDPGFFSERFPFLLKSLVGGKRLTLCITSPDPESFDELRAIKDVIEPQGCGYVLLRCPQIDVEHADVPAVGVLFFEWPSENLQHLVDNWFGFDQVSIEGYVSSSSVLPQLA